MPLTLKSNKGFTMQDAIIGMAVLVIFAGTIGGCFLTIYRVQSETKLTAVVGLYGIQIMENIDKISYGEIKAGMENHYRELFHIPDSIGVNLAIVTHNTENTIKKVKLTLTYTFEGKPKELVLERLKVKEV